MPVLQSVIMSFMASFCTSAAICPAVSTFIPVTFAIPIAEPIWGYVPLSIAIVTISVFATVGHVACQCVDSVPMISR